MKFIQLFTVILFIAFSGCQSLAYKQMQAKNPMAKNAAKSPAKMVGVWSSYAQTMPEGKAVRGVAGRVHFYTDSNKKKPVKVDGNVNVFVFDAEEKDPAHSKPLRVYQFNADTLEKHYSFKKPIGHGYDFFLPFDELGGEEKKLCIMTRFDDGLDDNLVVTQPINTILQGTKREMPESPMQQFLTEYNVLKRANEELAAKAADKPIQQVNYENEKNERKGPERKTETIQLNADLTKQLGGAK
ncbi:MAG: hypothetical protein LBN39_09465 [Planctomycetaceae bacterium]|jgi:hypothetical protein|nr:hypothetical protein [Planctomycetaceae bacterium]